MITSEKIAFGVLIVILIFMVFVVSVAVWAHGDSQCLKGQGGNTRLSNGGWVKVTGHLSGADLDGYQGHRYLHGHRKQYYNAAGQGTTQTKSYFDIDFDNVDSDYFRGLPDHNSCPSPPDTINACPPNTNANNHRGYP